MVMFGVRLLFTALRSFKSSNVIISKPFNVLVNTSFTQPRCKYSNSLLQSAFDPTPKLLKNPALLKICNDIPCRTVTKFSIRKGKRKSVKTVLRRFYRLHWGGWIRTIAGRHRRIWSKSYSRRLRMQQHVLCNATQCTLLDKMVGSYWRKPKYYVNDPYEPYHTREEFQFTYKKPKPYFPPE